MATTPITSGAGGVLYRLDGQLRVAAFVELALARPRRDEAPGASDAATAPVAVGESYLSRVGCVRPGFLVRSIDDLRRGEATSMPHFHRWSAAPPVAMSPARCVATWINRGDDAVVIELPVRGAQASATCTPGRAGRTRQRVQSYTSGPRASRGRTTVRSGSLQRQG